jgi:hypothetical protein
MTLKDLLIQELENVSDPSIGEVPDFVRFLKAKKTEDEVDLAETRLALAEIKQEGTVAWADLKVEASQESNTFR